MLELGPWRMLVGRGRRQVVLVGFIVAAVFLLVRQLQHPQPVSEVESWLRDAALIPKVDYNWLLLQRTDRKPAWPNYAGAKWHATTEQQHALNQVIKAALLQRGKKGGAHKSRLWAERRLRVKAATKYAWDAYAHDAFGSDEYHPLSRRGENMTQAGVGYFIADVLDTLLLIGLKDEYKQGRDHLAATLTFDQPGTVSLFETTIRVLGGLLSAYHWSGETDAELLRLADELGDRLAWSFGTPTGIPPETVQLRPNGKPYAYMSSTAEIGTLQLEFRYLAKLTGKQKYRRYVDRVMNVMLKAPKYDGLAPIYMDATSGTFTGGEIRLGSRGDSYYEYLLKQWLQTRQSESQFRVEYDAAMEGVKRYLVTESPNQKLTYVGELHHVAGDTPLFNPKMDHLVCFLAGNLALGATKGRALSEIPPVQLSARDREDLILARELADTCVHMYFDTKTGLSPELVYFRHTDQATGEQVQFNKDDQLVLPEGDMLARSGDRHNLLRPETVESLFVLWRITGEEKWREYGWRIFNAFEEWARLPAGGFTSLRDITVVPPPREDKMETFFVSETLKYLYLLFSDSDPVPLTGYVFNTEAHPLPQFSWDE
ncbi:mannosyl-oligosaccharide alpha-1,2-mannosidase [Coemansia sp. BCRC 34301]|nr:mannosyl-oligosaccharide alpha-1,2-mannosidase [Coemansia sp. BCRC 34301]